jgi:hypothetical protein
MALFQQTKLLLEFSFSKLQLTTEKQRNCSTRKGASNVETTRKEAKEST